MEKYTEAKKKIIENKQEQLLKYIDNNEQLQDEILKIDFKELNALYKQSVKDEKIRDYKIEPINYIDKEKLSDEEKENYEKIGANIIKQGNYAIVTMAGGSGTRLGHNGPKGTFDFGLDTHKTIFEILTDRLKETYKKYNRYITWYIMTSKQNHEETIKFFEKNNYFGYSKEDIIFFNQEEYPVLNEDGKLLIDKNKKINKAADGHGGIFKAIKNSNILDDMKKRNIEWTFIGPVDNVLVKMVDELFIGLCEANKVLVGAKSIIKSYPEERVGVFCLKDKKPAVMEYTEISKEMAEMKNENDELVYSESHINCNLFNIKIIENLCKHKLPYHSAHKKIEYLNEEGKLIKPEKPNAYKYESFIFDAFEKLDKIEILRVKREEEFAPIKNVEGQDSPETARKLYENFYNKK